MFFFFLDGPAGTGKPFLYTTLLHAMRGKGEIVTPVASTGIAATLLSGGRTPYSVFKIPILLNATSTCNTKRNSKKAQILLKIKPIIWDEALMTHYHAFLAVSRILWDITKCQEPFIGKVVCWRFSPGTDSDFTKIKVLDRSKLFKKHSLWSNFIKFIFSMNMREIINRIFQGAFGCW